LIEQPYECPTCHNSTLDTCLRCHSCGACYPKALDRPILFAKGNTLFGSDDYLDAFSDSPPVTNRKSSLTGLSVNLSIDRMIPKMVELLGDTRQTILVVGGGRQRGWLDPMLRERTKHHVIYCDVDKGADVDIFCDAHDLPFKEGYADGLIQTAVLEHVMYPEKAASEISRVVKEGGLIYSELPFMQQVHEGAYDFTRYTLSGHRRLLNNFEEIDTGMVAGPATALLWSIENFLLSFSATALIRKFIKVGVRLFFGWIKYFDYILCQKPQAMDAASCTYFLGRRRVSVRSDTNIIESYRGHKHVHHV
jgi:SAM-dependent methyltransferase